MPTIKILLLVFQLAVTAGIFAVDMLLPLGWSVWIAYFLLLPAAAWRRTARHLFFWTALWSALIVADLFLSPAGGDVRMGLLDRTVGIMSLWVLSGSVFVHRRLQARLQASEENFRSLFHVANLGMARADVTTRRYRRVNAAYCGFTGYSELELLALTVEEINHPDDRQQDRERFERMLRGDAPDYQSEKRFVRKDGSVAWVLATGNVIRDAEGRPLQAWSVVQDITARKEAEQALQQLNETLEQRIADQTREIRLLAEAVANLGEGVLITSDHAEWPEPPIVFVNDAMRRMSGYAANELLGQSPALMWGGDTDQKVLLRIKAELSAGRSCSAEMVSYRKDGSYYDAELFITPLFNHQGRRTNFVSIYRDISQRKRAETALCEREQWLSAILATAFNPIVTTDRLGVITSANRATERLFGYGKDELVGQNLGILMPSLFRDRDGDFTHYLDHGPTPTIGIGREAVALRKDGSAFPIDLAVSTVDQYGFTAIIRDLSEYKELQKHVIEVAASEQQRIGQELHDGTGQELTGLALFATTLVDALTRAQLTESASAALRLLSEEDFSRVQKIAGRLSRGLADACRHVQELSHGIMPVQIDAGGLQSALDDLAAVTSALPNVTCRFLCADTIVVANNTTASHLYRIAQEAVNNALRHGRADQIVIALLGNDSKVTLEIRDNGIGFDPAVRHRSGPAGNGMGLRIMDYRAGMIGGVLNLERLPDGGMVVRCTVPTLGGNSRD